MSFKTAITAFTILSLTACGPSAIQGVSKAAEVSSGPFGMMKADAVKVDTASAFKNLDKVVVGSFTVGFATYKTASSKGIKGGGTGARNTLVGIDGVTMQKITDEAYKSFVCDLKGKGYSVVDRSDLLANADFAGTKSYPNPYEDSSGGFFGEKSVTKYFAPSSFSDIKMFQGDIPGVTGGFAMANPVVGAAKYSSATGTKVLHVVYLLDFANNSNTTGGVMRWTNNVKMAQGLTVVPNASKIGVISDMGGMMSSNGSLAIGQPITSGKEFASIKDDTTDLHNGAEAVGNVISVLGGFGDSSSSDYTFTARPNDYRAAAMDAFHQANNALVDKMAGLK